MRGQAMLNRIVFDDMTSAAEFIAELIRQSVAFQAEMLDDDMIVTLIG
jgi:hypothetical protein